MPGRDHRPAKAVGSKTTHPRAGALISFSDAYQQEIHSQGIASDGNGAVFISLYFFYLSATLLFDLRKNSVCLFILVSSNDICSMELSYGNDIRVR